jgi:hypothetical protein
VKTLMHRTFIGKPPPTPMLVCREGDTITATRAMPVARRPGHRRLFGTRSLEVLERMDHRMPWRTDAVRVGPYPRSIFGGRGANLWSAARREKWHTTESVCLRRCQSIPIFRPTTHWWLCVQSIPYVPSPTWLLRVCYMAR